MVPRTYAVQFPTVCNFNFRGSDVHMCAMCICGLVHTPECVSTHVYTHILKKIKDPREVLFM